MALHETEFQTRNSLIDDVFHGRKHPDEAEAEAARLNLRPLSTSPDISLFDPMREATWSLGMTVAWICWRTPDKVRNSWEEYCQECWDWQPHHSRLPVNGGKEWNEVIGWELKQRLPGSLSQLGLLEAFNSVLNDEPVPLVTVKSATEQLWRRLTNGELYATALKASSGNIPAQIPAHEWPYLREVAARDLSDELRYENKPLHIEYRSITLRRVDICQIWREQNEVTGTELEVPKRGAPPSADWDIYFKMLEEKIEQDGYPDRSNIEGWSKQADVERWLAGLAAKDGRDPAPSTIRSHASGFLEKIRNSKH